MKIDKETRAKIMALYWGQPFTDGINIQLLSEVSFPKYFEIEDWHIPVTPLSQITDEDARVIHQGHNASDFIRYFNGDMDLAMKSLNTRGFDYLRSRGYALPYMNYSVDDLVSAGVFKLRAG